MNHFPKFGGCDSYKMSAMLIDWYLKIEIGTAGLIFEYILQILRNFASRVHPRYANAHNCLGPTLGS